MKTKTLVILSLHGKAMANGSHQNGVGRKVNAHQVGRGEISQLLLGLAGQQIDASESNVAREATDF